MLKKVKYKVINMFFPVVLSTPNKGRIINNEIKEIKYAIVTFTKDSIKDCFFVCIILCLISIRKEPTKGFIKELLKVSPCPS